MMRGKAEDVLDEAPINKYGEFSWMEAQAFADMANSDVKSLVRRKFSAGTFLQHRICD